MLDIPGLMTLWNAAKAAGLIESTSTTAVPGPHAAGDVQQRDAIGEAADLVQPLPEQHRHPDDDGDAGERIVQRLIREGILG